MNREADTITAKAKMDNNKCEDVVDGVMNLNLDAKRQTTARAMDVSTTSVYVPEKTPFTWGTKVCEPMDDTWMLMNGWN